MTGFVLACAPLAWGQQAPPVTIAPSGASPAASFSYLPKEVITAGGGFSSPNGKFAYLSESHYVGQGTYATVAVEQEIIDRKVIQCTLGGATKLLYQFGLVSIGLTGMGGGCGSEAAGSGQGFIDVRWGKLGYGNTITVTKNTSGGFKVTLGFRWAN